MGRFSTHHKLIIDDGALGSVSNSRFLSINSYFRSS